MHISVSEFVIPLFAGHLVVQSCTDLLTFNAVYLLPVGEPSKPSVGRWMENIYITMHACIWLFLGIYYILVTNARH